MAFENRGSGPSFGGNDGDNKEDKNIGNGGPKFHRGYWFRPYYCTYIPLDNTYVIMQMIVTFTILIIGAIAYLTTYKSDIIDPIENTKKLFINAHLITIGILLGITLLFNYFSKDAKSLIKRLIVTLAISIIIMFSFIGVKLHMDKTYTKTKFNQIYSEQGVSEEASNKQRVDLGLSGVKIKTEKEYYVDECVELYNIFKTKTYGILGIHLLLNLLLIYQIYKLVKIENKKDRLKRDDKILFDEEENVKI